MADWPAKKNAAFTVTFPIYDADGDLVAGATGLDSEVSKDGGTFTDVSPGEATEIATSSGVYALALSATEMNADIVCTITKSNGKTAVNVMYTVARQLVDLAYPATSGRSIQVESDGMVHGDVKEWLGSAPNALQSGRVDGYVGAMAAGVLTATAIAADAIVAAKVAADVSAEIADAVWDELKAGHTVADSFGDYLDDEISSRAAPGDQMDLVSNAVDSASVANGAIHSAAIGANAINAASITADAITGAKVAADVSAEIADAVWDELKSGHAVGDSFGAYLDAAITSRAVSGGAMALVDGAITSAKLAAGAIAAAAFAAGAINAAAIATNAIDADALAADVALEIADAILIRDVDNVESSAPVHSLTTAILKAVSRVRDNAGTLEIYRTNGTTLHASQTITGDAGLNPVKELTAGS
jgi:hypothetical protein